MKKKAKRKIGGKKYANVLPAIFYICAYITS